MRRLLIVLVVAGLLLPAIASAIDVLDVDASKYMNRPSFLGHVPDRFVVVLKDGSSVNHRRDARVTTALSSLTGFEELAQKYQVNRLQPQFPGSDVSLAATASGKGDLARHYKVSFASGTLEEAMADYAALPDVERVEPIGIHLLFGTPNDGNYTDQWHYYDTYGMEADMGWDLEPGDANVLVGDLDIGFMYDHGDLGGSNPPGPSDASTNGNIWVNTGETPGNGTDDDGNGYTDDVIGWDFVASTSWYSYTCTDIDCGGADNEPSDGNGHGTHTAGTIAAITNNGYAGGGVAGGWGDGTFAGGGNGVKVVPCRIGYQLNYFGQDVGVVIMDYVAEAMYYMADLKVAGWNVAAINCSFGSSNSGGLGAACDYLIAQDVVVCVAAGNSSSSSADYLSSRGDCVDVAATDQSGDPASFTNYGSWVDIAAPGVDILSTMTDPTNPGVDYIAAWDGTSMACPHVAGAIGLLESYDPSLSATDKINLILDAGNVKAYGGSLDLGVGILDVRACLDDIGPSCDVTAGFTANTTSGCANLTVNFTDQSTGTGVDGWSWTFGDGGTSTAQNPSHTYTAAGTYTVSLTASSSSQSCNDIETKTSYITVSVGPTASFTGSPTSGEVPLTVTFSNASSGATSYSWTFGDGGTSTAANPSHTYNSAGTFTVALTATNACGDDTQTRTSYISVTCTAPTASFTGTPTSGYEGMTVDFTDASTGATSWSWTFGDGGTSTAQNPSYTYNTAGTYTVALTATNSCGSDTQTRTDYITVSVCTNPVAAFSGAPTSGDYPLTVNFTDASTDATSWSWTFGDGGTSTAQNPSHTYTAAGTYTVELTATNSCGSDVATETDYINVTTPVGDYASLPYSTGFETGAFDQYWETYSNNSEGRIQITTAYTPRGSYHLAMDDNTNGSSYAQNEAWLNLNLAGQGDVDLTFWWKEFSDETHTQDGVYFSDNDGASFVKVRDLTGGSSTYQQIALDVDALASANGLSLTGTFVVKFQQYDNYGLTTDGMTFDDIEVTSNDAPPVAAFSGTPTSGAYPLTVAFTDASSGATSWSWTFGDGGTSTVQNPSHEYTAAGTYTVTLTATNAFGSDDETKVDYITVTAPPPPTADFVGSPTSGVYPLTVDFTDQSTDGPTSWSWTFGDGGTSTAQNPTHDYLAVGTYTVSLTATNAYGSDVETKTDYITVTDVVPWTTITYDDFEGGFGNYTDGGGDCALYTSGTYSHQGSNSARIRDNSGTASSFYHTSSYDVSGYAELEVDFWFIAVSMDNANEDFWLQYYDGSSWQTIETWARTTDFDNGTFYNKVVTISSGSYNFPTNAKLRFMCDASGNRDYVYIDEVEWRGGSGGTSGFVSSIGETIEIPEEYSLTQNYPNPFNPTTMFAFTLPEAGHATLTVYNVAGQKVATLVDASLEQGVHYAEWDAADFASGVYFYKLQAGEFAETRKMILLK